MNQIRLKIRYGLRGLVVLITCIAAILGFAQYKIGTLRNESDRLNQIGIRLPVVMPTAPGEERQKSTIAVPVSDPTGKTNTGVASVTLAPTSPWLAYVVSWFDNVPNYRLAKLQLNAPSIDDEALRSLAKIPTLESILISGTAVTDTGVDAFRRSLPKTLIAIGENNDNLSTEYSSSVNEALSKQDRENFGAASLAEFRSNNGPGLPNQSIQSRTPIVP